MGNPYGCNNDLSSPYDISRLTFKEIEQEINRFPALVLPLGGCEPYGSGMPLGLPSRCSEAIALALSCRRRMLMAPALQYGCSTSFSAFGGTTGIKPRTLMNLLCEILRQFSRQGIRFVVIIDPLMDNGPALDEAKRRVTGSDRNLHIILIRLQQDERIVSFVRRRWGFPTGGRNEGVMRALGAFAGLNAAQSQNCGKKAIPTGWEERYRTWRRRGGDPQQLRKLFPEGCTEEAGGADDPEIGREIFEYIGAIIDESLAPLHQ
jgi:creatinine amidohydrolase/Fe(II)-dependent formamide hydrolase-like protein